MAKENLSADKKRALAFDLFMHTDKSQKEICDIVGWSVNTFTANKEKGSWEELKGSSTVSAEKIIANLYQRIYEMTEDDNFSADQLVKMAKTIESLSQHKATLSQVMNVMEEFTSWLFPINQEEARILNKRQREFIDHLINTGGK